LKIYISQRSAVTQLQCGVIFNHHFTGNFLKNVPPKELLESVNIWHRYWQKYLVDELILSQKCSRHSQNNSSDSGNWNFQNVSA